MGFLQPSNMVELARNFWSQIQETIFRTSTDLVHSTKDSTNSCFEKTTITGTVLFLTLEQILGTIRYSILGTRPLPGYSPSSQTRKPVPS